MPFVQAKGIQSVGSVDSVGISFTNAVSVGNTLVAFLVTAAQDPSITAITDNLSNTYTRGDVTVSTGAEVGGYYSLSITTSGSCTVTGNAAAGNDFQSLAIFEISGVVSLNTSANLPNFVGTNPSLNISPTAMSLVVAAMTQAGTGTIAITEDTAGGWILAYENEGTANMPINAVYRDLGVGVFPVAWTLPTSQTTDAVVLAFALSTLEQEGFIFRNDDGSETTATSAGPQDTNVTKPSGTTSRLRTLANLTGPTSIAPQQEYRINGGPWRRLRSY
jgi:hypothetical protein